MSGPTYRITTEHTPTEIEWTQWQARIVRVSDGEAVDVEYGPSEARVLELAAAWIRAANGDPLEGGVYESDDAGNVTPLRPSPTYGAEAS